MIDTVEKLQSHLKSDFIEARMPRERRIFARVGVGSFREAARYAILEMGFGHLSTITGIDLGGEIELVYHLIQKDAIALSLSVRVPKDKAVVPDITDIMPNAVIYEREVHELLGVDFEGLQDASHLLLPDGWPEGVYPLRKDQTYGVLNEIKLKKG